MIAVPRSGMARTLTAYETQNHYQINGFRPFVMISREYQGRNMSINERQVITNWEIGARHPHGAGRNQKIKKRQNEPISL